MYPDAYNRVFILLNELGTEERPTNQITQTSAWIEEASATDTIDVNELIELAAAVENRPVTPTTNSSLPPSSIAYSPRLEQYDHVPEWCWCQREVCTCNY
jgi:hypothetical protein